MVLIRQMLTTDVKTIDMAVNTLEEGRLVCASSNAKKGQCCIMGHFAAQEHVYDKAFV